MQRGTIPDFSMPGLLGPMGCQCLPFPTPSPSSVQEDPCAAGPQPCAADRRTAPAGLAGNTNRHEHGMSQTIEQSTDKSFALLIVGQGLLKTQAGRSMALARELDIARTTDSLNNDCKMW